MEEHPNNESVISQNEPAMPKKEARMSEHGLSEFGDFESHNLSASMLSERQGGPPSSRAKGNSFD
jgi:hypothetical protein